MQHGKNYIMEIVQHEQSVREECTIVNKRITGRLIMDRYALVLTSTHSNYCQEIEMNLKSLEVRII